MALDDQLWLADELRGTGNISPITPNKYMLGLSQFLHGAKDTLNWPGKLPKWVPLVGDMGAGDFVFGEGPEYAEDLAYGFGRGKGGGLQRRLDPRAVDLAGTPTFGAVTGAKLMANQIRRGVTGALEGATNLGRRKFLGKAGAAAGGAAAGAAVGPDLLKAALPNIAEDVAPAVAKQAPRVAAAAVARFGKHQGAVDAALERMRQSHLADKDNIEWAIENYGDEAIQQEVKESGLHSHHAAEAEPHLQKDWDDYTREEFAARFEEDLAEAQKLYGDDVDTTWLTSNSFGVHDPKARLEKSPHVNIVDEREFYGNASPEELAAKYDAQQMITDYFKQKGFTSEELQRMNVTGRYPPDFPSDPITINDLNQAINNAQYEYLHGPNRWSRPLSTDDFISSLSMEERKVMESMSSGPYETFGDTAAKYAAQHQPQVKLTDNDLWSKLTGGMENPSRRGMLEKSGGLLAATAAAVAGIGGGAKVLKKVMGHAAEEAAPVVAREAAPAAASAASKLFKVLPEHIAPYKPTVDEILAKIREDYVKVDTPASGETLEWLLQPNRTTEAADDLERFQRASDKELFERYKNGTMSPEDEAYISRLLEEHYDEFASDEFRSTLEKQIGLSLQKTGGADIDPNWLREYMYEMNHPPGAKFEKSPHVNVVDSPPSRENQLLLQKWLEDNNFSLNEVERMMITGEFPRNFPQVPVNIQDVYGALRERAYAIEGALNADPATRHARPMGPDDFARTLNNDEYTAMLEHVVPGEQFPAYRDVVRSHAAENYPGVQLYDEIDTTHLATKDKPPVAPSAIENPERRSVLQKTGGVLAALGVTAAGLGGAAKVLKKATAAAGHAADEVVPKAVTHAATGSVDNIVKAAMQRGKEYVQRFAEDIDYHDAVATDVLGKDEYERLLNKKEGWTDADQESWYRIIEHQTKSQEARVAKTIREEAEDALTQYGEVDPTYLDFRAHGPFAGRQWPNEGPMFELPNSPHVKFSKNDWMEQEDMIKLDDWLASKGYTDHDMKRFIITGRYPPDFPSDIEISYQDIMHYVDLAGPTPKKLEPFANRQKEFYAEPGSASEPGSISLDSGTIRNITPE